MSVFYKQGEIRLRQYREATSAANADAGSIGYPGVPEGKLWVITAFGYMPSVAETQVISIEKASGPNYFSLLNPVSLALNPAHATFIEQGMEYVLFPGEFIWVRRGDHTAGSTMYSAMQLIEIDLPLYTYDEPQVVKKQERALSSVRSMLGGGRAAGTGPLVGPRGGPGRPGGGGPAPI